MADGATDDSVHDGGLIGACVLDGKGGARWVDWDGLRAWTAADGPLWLHLHRNGEQSQQWVREESGLDPLTVSALLTSASRPRATVVEDGLLLILRGANLNPDADPEDMISLRMWINGSRMISLRRERFQTVDAIVEALEGGRGPKTVSDLAVQIVVGVTERVAPVVDELSEHLDVIEDDVANPNKESSRDELIDIRREIIALARYLAPQKQALIDLAEYSGPALDKKHRRALKETAARLERVLADIDANRARASVIQDEIVTQQSEAMNRRVYTLTVVAVLFLPLTLISGMLGMNVGGVPGEGAANGFVIVSGALAVIGVLIYMLLRKLRWL